MQPHKELSTKERIIETTTNVLQTLKYPLLGLLGALVVFIIVYVIVTEVRADRIERSTQIVESIEDDFNDWLETEDGEERDALGADILDRISSLLDGYPRYYAAQRALHIRGRLFFRTGAWEQSKESFVEIADRFPSSYLAPVSLVNAATAMEEAGRIDDAIALLARVTEEFETPETPAVLFSLGRLSETAGKPDDAVMYYEQLLDRYPSSGWTNLAQSRIIGIKIDRS